MHKRLFYLDNLKTFALLLGVLFHTSIVYAPNIGYAIKSGDLHYFFSILVHLIHLFRMPLFFFLSGFFSYMVLDKKGGKNFTLSRMERMFAPLLVGLFLFAPVQYYLVYNQTHDPISFLNYYPKFFTFAEFDFSHIWFLVYLFIFSFLLLLEYKLQFKKRIFTYFAMIKKYFVESKIFTNKIERVVSPTQSAEKTHLFSNFRTTLFFFRNGVIFCFAAFFFINCFFNKDHTILRIQPVLFVYYFSFFLMGVIVYQKNILQNLSIESFTKSKWIYCFSGFLLLFSLYLYLDEVDPYWMNFTYEWKRVFIRVVHLFLESILAWSFIIVLLYFFKYYFDRTDLKLDYLRNSGMSIYLIHHPISLILADFFRIIAIPIFIKVCIHGLLVYGVSFFFYHFIIKKSFILKRVFGTK